MLLMVNPSMIYLATGVWLAIFFFALLGLWDFCGFIADLWTGSRMVDEIKRLFAAHEEELRDQIRAELLEEYGDPEDYDGGRRLSEEAIDVCADRLRRALEAMQRGDLKEARYEIEDAHEELAA